MNIFDPNSKPKKSLTEILARLTGINDAATGNDGEPQFVWYNKWRTFRFVAKGQKDEYGISTGRADWPENVVPHSRFLRQQDAEAIATEHSAMPHLLKFITTVNDHYENNDTATDDVVREALTELHEKLADVDLFPWALKEKDD